MGCGLCVLMLMEGVVPGGARRRYDSKEADQLRQAWEREEEEARRRQHDARKPRLRLR